ncbi:hypothetical protein K8640_11965 [Myxococcus sp. XM-1-1-1]|uniref:hypothetical protein n=1 Tax=Myxococcus sp. XM-1-1-1 TaxID=2874602 RepID=UPI001CBCED04|nr:hypothetical protein [Myxococcus sp. XM-1-1-1]MBZ4408934.1 hypothetical protein [Myxococcus sp. XM-1-1-1]
MTEEKGLSFEEWALGPSARAPGWDAVEEFMSSEAFQKTASGVLIFDRPDARGGFVLSLRLAAPLQGASGRSEVVKAMRRDALSVLLLDEEFVFQEHFPTYDRVAIGALTDQEHPNLFGDHVAGLASAMASSRSALVIWHDGDPIILIRKGASPE